MLLSVFGVEGDVNWTAISCFGDKEDAGGLEECEDFIEISTDVAACLSDSSDKQRPVADCRLARQCLK